MSSTEQFYACEFPEGIALWKCIGNKYTHCCSLTCDYEEGKRQIYKLVNPVQPFHGFTFAVSDPDDPTHFLCCKELPAEPYYFMPPCCSLIPYSIVHRTINPVEAEEFRRLNNESEERENRLLDGLASLQSAVAAIERADTILASSSSSNSRLEPGPVFPNYSGEYISQLTQFMLGSISSEQITAKKTKASIEKPQPHVSKLVIADAVASATTCPITTNPLTLTNAVCVGPCYHVFEKEAIQQWLTTKETCPTCRQPCCL